MKIAVYSPVLNHHQIGVADELYHILGKEYCFVEITECHDMKGALADYTQRPYLLKAWRSSHEYSKAMELAKTADVCVFAGCEALPFEKERLKRGLISFDMGERMLKRGWLNLVSPRILKIAIAYHLGRWKDRPAYKLSCSAFTAHDCQKLRMYKDRCYKWGYFTSVDDNLDIDSIVRRNSSNRCINIMWCGRFLTLKHPELMIELAYRLDAKGYDFHIDMYGDDTNVSKFETRFKKADLERLISMYGIESRITLKGNVPNNDILEAMRDHSIFIFTSDSKEGWGAVANEALANGCVLVASDAIGSSPYLVRERYNGLMFKSCDADSLTDKVEWLLNNKSEMRDMQRNAYISMRDIWSPAHAAESLIHLIECIKRGSDSDILYGPCSKA